MPSLGLLPRAQHHEMEFDGRWGLDERTEYIVQHLYAAGLSLQLCLDQDTRPPDRARLERAIAVLEGLIAELSPPPWRPADQ